MIRAACFVIAFLAGFFLSLPLSGQEAAKQKAKYVKKYKDPVLEEMKKINKEAQKQREEETAGIRRRQAGEKKKKKEDDKRLRFDFKGIQKPESLESFQKVFYFPPIRQYLTGTCWCFSTTSFFESEVCRLTGRKIKLSEMFTVYYEYLEEARRFVRERGESFFEEGSEGNVVMKIWRQYGVVPAGAYKGELSSDGRFDHSGMAAEMRAYLDLVKEKQYWDEEVVLGSLRLIMNKYMGPPPERFEYNGVEMTPKTFLADVAKLNLDDYVCVMSTLSQPFFAFGEYEVEGNWWHSKDYYNLPLPKFYELIKFAIHKGYSVRLNGDVSEPGLNGFEDAAVIPSFDIPAKDIDQSAREFRFNNKTTTDDHDIHLVGCTRVNDFDWFLIKDSASSPQHGKFKGYYFYREDYIKLKMLTFIIHNDPVKAVVKEFRVN